MDFVTDIFDLKRSSETEQEVTLRVYVAGKEAASPLCLLFIHGAGSSAMTWHNQIAQFRRVCTVIAPDMRGHGASACSADVSIVSLVRDISFILIEMSDIIKSKSIVLVGHSLGGSIASKLVAANLNSNISGLIVLDVAEDTVLNSLPRMEEAILSWPRSFDSAEVFAEWCAANSRPQSLSSALTSTPFLIEKASDGKWYPRTDLLKTKPYWREWFEGFDESFLGATIQKCLVMSHLDVLDRKLTIAHMQGAYELNIISNPSRSHFFHEDSPEELLHIIIDFLKKKKFISGDDLVDIYSYRHIVRSQINHL